MAKKCAHLHNDCWMIPRCMAPHMNPKYKFLEQPWVHANSDDELPYFMFDSKKVVHPKWWPMTGTWTLPMHNMPDIV